MFDHGYVHFILTFASWVGIGIGSLIVGLLIPICLFGFAEEVGHDKSVKWNEEKQIALNIFGTLWLLFVGASLVYFFKTM